EAGGYKAKDSLEVARPHTAFRRPSAHQPSLRTASWIVRHSTGDVAFPLCMGRDFPTLPRMASRKLKILGWTLSSVLLIGIGVGIWVPKITLFSLPEGEIRQLDTPAIIQKIQ